MYRLSRLLRHLTRSDANMKMRLMTWRLEPVLRERERERCGLIEKQRKEGNVRNKERVRDLHHAQ